MLDDEEAVHVPDQYLSLYLNAARGEGKTLLGRYAARAEAAGVKVATQLSEGHVVAQLLRIARERAVDLIVLGAKGTSRVPRLFMGSVSEKVTRAAPCPVLVVK